MTGHYATFLGAGRHRSHVWQRCGVIGGFAGLQHRLKERRYSSWSRVASWVYTDLSPLAGGVSAFLLFMISGDLFESLLNPFQYVRHFWLRGPLAASETIKSRNRNQILSA